MFADFSDRRKYILEAIVDDFIQTAEPVGSFTITRHYLKDVSPATVRNEMHELEQTGYITHPHTSSGRIPTDIGYRYYVDNIMETKTVSGKEIALIRSGIRKIGRGFEEIVRGTLKAASTLLNYAAMFVSFKNKKVSSVGLSNALKQPEFQSIDSARQMIETLEHEEMMARLFEEYAGKTPISIKIGHENRLKELKDLSVVIANYDIKGFGPGAFGIIGPTRMDYNRVTSVLRYISNELEEMISTGELNV